MERETNKDKNRMMLARPQRQAALILIYAYWTVFGEAPFILAGTPRVDIVLYRAARTRKKLLGLDTG